MLPSGYLAKTALVHSWGDPGSGRVASVMQLVSRHSGPGGPKPVIVHVDIGVCGVWSVGVVDMRRCVSLPAAFFIHRNAALTICQPLS